MSFRVALRRVALALLAATFANGINFKSVPEQAVELADSAQSMRIFCFVWTTRRSGDQALEPEVRRQLNKCDGHLFFTDTGSTGPDSSDIVKLNIPAQDVGRSDEKWLYHRNMVGVLPSWTHIFNKGLNDQYDWFIHLEMDHFLSPNRARANIAQWLSIRGKEPNATNDIPIVLMWGNAFVFNKKFVNAMKLTWHTLGAVAGPGEGQGKGCPLFLKGKFEWPASCSQDIYYPQLFSDHGRSLLPDDADFAGASGCGQEAKNQVNEEYPLGCFEMAKKPDRRCELRSGDGGHPTSGEDEGCRISGCCRSEVQGNTSWVAPGQKQLQNVLRWQECADHSPRGTTPGARYCAQSSRQRW